MTAAIDQTHVSTVTQNPWQTRANDLATFVWKNMVNRTDRHGRYVRVGPRNSGSLSIGNIIRHFRGESVIGLNSTSPGNTCRWLAFDFDNHEENPAVAEENFAAASAMMNRLTEHGIRALLEDSDGQGGYHIWALFSMPVPAHDAFRLVKWISEGEHEAFPKQPQLSGKGVGNWLRLPGRHHKRSHYSRFWGGGEWLDDDESIEALLHAPLNDPAVLSSAPVEETALPNLQEHEPPDEARIREALHWIPADDYDTWIRIGQCLHQESEGLLSLWDEWSARSGKYRVGDCEEKWSTFERRFDNGVSLGTLFREAQQRGWSGGQHKHTSIQVCGSNEIPFEGLDIADLEQFADEPIDWLVDDVFSADQPTLFGARSKCLKTTLLTDLTVALASGTDWLNHFTISKPRRVLFITGESNKRAAARRIRKASRARGLTLSSLKGMIRVEAVNFPKLPSPDHCEQIKRVIDKHQPEVLILDPLYRGLTSDIDTHRMNQVGDAIVYFAQCCRPASLMLSHHGIKASAREYGVPPELEDMAGAGIAESCGNWWLIGRNEKYAWNWQHDLCVQFGGRDEQAGGRRILFHEKEWTSEVTSLHEFQCDQEESTRLADEKRKREEEYRKSESARASIQKAMMDQGALSKSEIEARSGVPQKLFRRTIAEMISEGKVDSSTYQDSQNRTQKGWILAR